MRKKKREIIQSWILKILPKANQVIYTLDTIYNPNIMTLAQGVLEIFCSQAYIGLQCSKNEKKNEKGNNSAMTSQVDKKKYGSIFQYPLMVLDRVQV